MKLSIVTGRPFNTVCLGCNKKIWAGDVVDYQDKPIRTYADLDGKSFNAYYCEPCAMPHLASNGNWFPANNGTETPFTTRTGKRLLYVWQPATGKHAYLDLSTDIVLSDEEASAALGL